MDWIFYIVVLVSGLLICFFFIKGKVENSDFSLKVSLFFSIALILIVLTKIFIEISGISFENRSKYLKNQHEYMELGGKYLGAYLSRLENKDIKSDKILIIDYPENFYLIGSQVEFVGDILKGLESGLKSGGGRYKISKVAKVSGEKEGIFWLKAAEFDRIILENQDAGIIVSLVGIPSDYENMSFQDKMENPPKFVFFGGDVRLLHPAIKSGTVLAVINLCPGKSLGSSKKPDMNNIEESFFDNFILIEPGSVDFAREAFPVLFK